MTQRPWAKRAGKFYSHLGSWTFEAHIVIRKSQAAKQMSPNHSAILASKEKKLMEQIKTTKWNQDTEEDKY